MVGRLSAISTAGAIVGTVITGFVLITRVPGSVIMVGLGAALIVVAVLIMGLTRRRLMLLPVLPVVVLGAGGVAVASEPALIDRTIWWGDAVRFSTTRPRSTSCSTRTHLRPRQYVNQGVDPGGGGGFTPGQNAVTLPGGGKGPDRR